MRTLGEVTVMPRLVPATTPVPVATPVEAGPMVKTVALVMPVIT